MQSQVENKTTIVTNIKECTVSPSGKPAVARPRTTSKVKAKIHPHLQIPPSGIYSVGGNIQE